MNADENLAPEHSEVGVDHASRAHALARAREAAAAKRAQGVQLYRDPLERARVKPKTLRLAIAAKCFSCTGLGQDSGWRATIRDCSVHSCPLHQHRPYQRRSESGE
jgi:hypothetical protein